MTTEEYQKTALEKDVRKAGCAYLRLQGWDYYPNVQSGMGVQKGLSDITAFRAGRVIWIEFKRASGGYLSPDQRKFRERILAAGLEYLEVHCVEDLYQLGDEVQMHLGNPR